MSPYSDSSLEKISEKQEQWEKGELKEVLDRAGEREGSFRSASGQEVKRLYTPEDVNGMDYEADLGFPGAYPFTRGAYPTMYRGRLWTRRQIAGFGTAKSTNERYRFLLDHGQTGISTDFDHPTLTGYDSDHELAEGEVGRLGVAVDTVKDMDELFTGISLDKASVSLTINHPAIIMLGMFLTVAQTQGVPWSALRGTVQNDSLKEFHGQKTFALSPGPSLKLTTDVVEVLHPACAQLVHNIHIRLPHQRSGFGCCARAGLHPGPRHGLRGVSHGAGPGSGRVRSQALILLRLPQRFPGGSGQVQGSAAHVGPDNEGALWSPEGPSPCECGSIPRPSALP